MKWECVDCKRAFPEEKIVAISETEETYFAYICEDCYIRRKMRERLSNE